MSSFDSENDSKGFHEIVSCFRVVKRGLSYIGIEIGTNRLEGPTKKNSIIGMGCYGDRRNERLNVNCYKSSILQQTHRFKNKPKKSELCFYLANTNCSSHIQCLIRTLLIINNTCFSPYFAASSALLYPVKAP